MRIAAIVAMSLNRVIGNNNQLPWHLPADLRYFKKITLGKPILLGRKTFMSIGRALPGRTNIVITRDIHFQAPGCIVVNSIEQGLLAAAGCEEILLIGGAELYHQLLPKVQRLYLTLIHAEFVGDAFFPVLDEKEWRESERIDCAADEENGVRYSFIVLDRVAGGAAVK